MYMAQRRPTHEVFRQKVPTPSYDKFVPATSEPGLQQGDQRDEERNVPSVDRLEELRRDDEAYLERVAQAERDNALEELEREKREGERFRRDRVAVKRRVNVADGVRGQVEQPLIGRLGLGSAVKKRRVGKQILKTDKGRKEEGRKDSEGTVKDRTSTPDQKVNDDSVDNLAKEAVQCVPLVSGYSSSSEDDQGGVNGAEAGTGDAKNVD